MCYETGSPVSLCSSSTSSSSSSSSRMHAAHRVHRQANLHTISQMREAFDLLDRDGDGNILESDLLEFLQISSLNKTLSADEIKRMIAVADINGDGAVSFDEFRLLLLQQPHPDHLGAATSRGPSTACAGNSLLGIHSTGGSYLEDMFRVLDRNGDGFLCSDDLKQVMNTMGQTLSADDLAEMLEKASGSNQSHVSFQDFVRFMTSPNPTKLF